MTVTDETVDVTVENENPDANVEDTTAEHTGEEGDSEEGRKRARDFTKYRQFHSDLADYINGKSGLDPVTPNQVKAVLLLRTDYANEPEQVAAREQRNAQIAAQKERFAGKTEEQIKAIKAEEKAREQAERFQRKAQEAIERANRLAQESSGSGEDLAAVVESAQNGETVEESEDEPKKRRGLRR